MLGFKIWKVKGHSMAPVIPSNCFVLAAKWLSIFPIREGHRLIIKHARYGIIVKKVALVDKNGFIWSKGENKTSLRVEQLGPVNKSQILGRVICVFQPESI